MHITTAVAVILHLVNDSTCVNDILITLCSMQRYLPWHILLTLVLAFIVSCSLLADVSSHLTYRLQ